MVENPQLIAHKPMIINIQKRSVGRQKPERAK
jgi:hypothetical protein